MKIQDNPLLKLVNRDSVDMVLAPNLEPIGRPYLRARRGALVRQHLEGLQRIGIVPAIGSTDTAYLVVQFFPDSDVLARPSLANALKLISALRQEHIVFETLPADPLQSVLATTVYKIPLHLERHAALQDEVYQVWLLFECERDRSQAWLTLQALLLSLGVERNTRVLPHPQYRPEQHTADVVWLPYYAGQPETIRGQSLGGTREGRSVLLNTVQVPPSEISVLPFTLAEIDAKEFDRLDEIAAPLRTEARAYLPQRPEKPRPPMPASDRVASDDDPNFPSPESDARSAPPLPLLPPPESEATPDDSVSVRLSVTATVRTELRRWLTDTAGSTLEQSLDMIRPLLQSRFFQTPVQFLPLWREALAAELDVNGSWVDELLWEKLDRLALRGVDFPDLLRRTQAVGLSEGRRATLLLKWLAQNGGRFDRDGGGCSLRWEGETYTVDNRPPFSVLFWTLSGGGGEPILLSAVYEAVLNTALTLVAPEDTATTIASALPLPVAQAPAKSSAGVTTHAISTVVLMDAVHRLVTVATMPDHPQRNVVDAALTVSHEAGRVLIEGPIDAVQTALEGLAGQTLAGSVRALRTLLAAGVARLEEAGITVEWISAGRGRRGRLRIAATEGTANTAHGE